VLVGVSEITPLATVTLALEAILLESVKLSVTVAGELASTIDTMEATSIMETKKTERRLKVWEELLDTPTFLTSSIVISLPIILKIFNTIFFIFIF